MDQNKLNEIVEAQARIYKPGIQKMMAEANEHDCHVSASDGCGGCALIDNGFVPPKNEDVTADEMADNERIAEEKMSSDYERQRDVDHDYGN